MLGLVSLYNVGDYFLSSYCFKWSFSRFAMLVIISYMYTMFNVLENIFYVPYAVDIIPRLIFDVRTNLTLHANITGAYGVLKELRPI